jgi:23S rRNA (adenine2030-N6)-methyltransferase
MNYRHAFHAGNFADVFKHAVLSRIIVHLRDKPQAFRVIDTHAGAGCYDLAGEEASRTGEWQDGIARLAEAALDPAAGELLAPYLAAVAALNPASSPALPRRYPGSPLLALSLMRPQDRLVACELEPHAVSALIATLKRDRRAKPVAIDGWVGLNAYVPPKERRGLAIIDPPFEEKDDFARLGYEFVRAWRKWPTGIYALWYPIKDRSGPDALAAALKAAGVPKILRCEIELAADIDAGKLRSCGLIVVNPPWRLSGELERMLPGLAAALSGGRGGRWRADWLAGEKADLQQQ